MTKVLDTVASRVYGASIKRGKDCRVLWTEGRLYVARSPTDVVVIATKEPVKNGSTFRAVLADGSDAVTFMYPSCGSCRKLLQTSEVGRMAQADILAFGAVDA